MKGKEFAKQSIELQEECDLSGDCIRRYLNKMAEQGLIIFRKKKYNNAPTYHFTIQNSLILDKIRILQNTNLAMIILAERKFWCKALVMLEKL